jgi:hypothetical protein
MAPRIFITRMPFLMAEIYMYLGRAALQLGDAAGASRAADEVARRDMPYSRGFAPALRATVAVWRGDRDAARALLRQAIAGFTEAGAAHMVAVCRHRLGALLDGDEGAALRAEVDAWMAAQQIANPARMLAFLSPGFDRAP